MNSMITVFNRLTNSELADCSLFKNILDFHYEKFKYFYKLISNLDLKFIDSIQCTEDSTTLFIYIEFLEIPKNFLKNKPKNEYFDLNIDKDGNKINITIDNKNISSEGEIYENRFDSN